LECVFKSAYLKPLKNGEYLSETIPCQPDTGGVTSIIKKDIEDMTRHVVSLVTWMALGDGSIVPAGKSARFTCSHKEANEDYVAFKTELLSFAGAKYSKYYHSGSDSYNFQIYTMCHPLFARLRRGMYLNGRKTITSHAIKLLTPLGLAIFYQDDGRYNKSKSVLSINQPTFSKIELEALAKGIVDRFGIIFRIRRSCTLKDGTIGYEMALRMKDKEKFFDIIEPYVVSSMSYKIGRGGDHYNVADEVLWSSWQHEEASRNV